eukprot:352695-Chlamydomonas_euryale.AAC.4
MIASGTTSVAVAVKVTVGVWIYVYTRCVACMLACAVLHMRACERGACVFACTVLARICTHVHANAVLACLPAQCLRGVAPILCVAARLPSCMHAWCRALSVCGAAVRLPSCILLCLFACLHALCCACLPAFMHYAVPVCLPSCE